MRVIGIDLGARRIGVAISDAGGSIASPYTVLQRSGDTKRDHLEILSLVDELQADRVVVGLPLSLDGSMGPAARAALGEVEDMEMTLTVPIETFDERFTTVTASRSMTHMKVRKHTRREIVDKMAAAIMLQNWLERAKHV